jgi:cytochrome c oxidase subunit 2
MRRLWTIAVLTVALPCAARAGVQDVLAPAADQASRIGDLWNLMLAVCGVMYLLVIGFLAWAIWRARGRLAGADPEVAPHDGRIETTLAGWAGLIVLGLLVLTTASFLIDRSLVRAAEPPLKIKATAHQWWWEIQYPDEADPSRTVRTANELHLPAGRTAEVELHADDVIHSFWVPNLNGKIDLIPGRINRVLLTPRRIGLYRGQCAEFCGLQHAHMALDVTVESPQSFAAWREAQLKPAPEPATPTEIQGRDLFVKGACATCHAIAGTDAAGQVAPDLTHVAGRRHLAAGALPYSKGALAAWINDPQGIKPGSNMPMVDLEPAEANALVDYLDSLK